MVAQFEPLSRASVERVSVGVAELTFFVRHKRWLRVTAKSEYERDAALAN